MLENLKKHKEKLFVGLVLLTTLSIISGLFVSYKKTTKELLETTERLESREKELQIERKKNVELQETVKRKTVVIKEIRVDGSSTETTSTEEVVERIEKAVEEERLKSVEKIERLEKELKFAKETKEIRRDKKYTVFGGYDPFNKNWMVGATYGIFGPVGVGMTWGSGFIGPSISIKF